MTTRSIFIIASAAIAVATSAPANAQTPAPAIAFGANLIVNGDAEADTGAGDDQQIVAPTGWKTTGEFTVVQYGAIGGFPDKKVPGPPDRGKNFFAGGNTVKSTAEQTIDLSGAADAIDADLAGFVLTGWLGGFSTQADNAQVAVTFLSAGGAELASAAIGPEMPFDRKNVTGLFRKTTKGTVPPTTRSARVVITSSRSEGKYNDGYADDLSLVLVKKPEPKKTPEPKSTTTPKMTPAPMPASTAT
jgi:hypothetical protein